MEDPALSPLIWLDMEMTGLDPSTCVPLQIAVVITDSDLQELDSSEVTIWQPEEALSRVEPFVRKMHTDNGLLERVRASEWSVAQAQREIVTVVAKWCPLGTGILAGNSIHTDRAFIKAYFPVLDGYLHYRMVDVSSIKELVVRWYGRELTFTKTSANHTALSDVRESIAELKHYRERLMRPAAG
jgi:oligoribonuclease